MFAVRGFSHSLKRVVGSTINTQPAAFILCRGHFTGLHPSCQVNNSGRTNQRVQLKKLLPYTQKRANTSDTTVEPDVSRWQAFKDKLYVPDVQTPVFEINTHRQQCNLP